jgi:hypothetical protein
MKMHVELETAPKFLTSTLDGVSGQPHAWPALSQGEQPPIPNVYEAGWIAEPV